MSTPAAPAGTATTYAARDHARAQSGARADAMPHLPPSAYPAAPPGVPVADLLWAQTVAGGGYANLVVAAGTTLQLTDLEGDACAHVLIFNADAAWERFNIADTTKVAWQAYLGAGHILLSDQGRAMATILADTSGAHDAFGATSTLAGNTARYGDGAPQSASPAGRELFTLAAAKHGLTRRDLPPSVSFFKGVRVDPVSGEFHWAGPSNPAAGAYLRLRAELPLVVLVVNVPHPLDPRETYSCGLLEVLAWPGTPTGPGDPLFTRSPEGERAYQNTAAYRALRGLDAPAGCPGPRAGIAGGGA
jgi:urea carboxylase-associated protein 2